jgi:hypothetical protein
MNKAIEIGRKLADLWNISFQPNFFQKVEIGSALKMEREIIKFFPLFNHSFNSHSTGLYISLYTQL